MRKKKKKKKKKKKRKGTFHAGYRQAPDSEAW